MQWYGVLGAALVAWSPLAVVLFGELRDKPQLVMIGVAACFMFVLASHTAALVWLAIPPLKDNKQFHMWMGVAVVEGFRYAFWRVYQRSERAFGKKFNEVVYLTEFSVVPAALSGGIGWGAAQSLLGFGILFAYHLDPTVTSSNATWYSSECSSIPVLFAQALKSAMYTLCNICWMVTAFASYYSINSPATQAEGLPFSKMGRPLPPAKGKLILAATWCLHIFAALPATVASCDVSLPLLALDSLASGALAVYCSKLVHAPRPAEASSGPPVAVTDDAGAASGGSDPGPEVAS